MAPAPARINSTYATTDGLTDRVTASWTHGLTDRRTKIDEKTGVLCPGEARNFGKEAGPKPQDSMFTDSSGGLRGTKVCRYNWQSAGSLGWPFPMLKYKYIYQIKYTEAILSNSTRKLLWFNITKMLVAV